MHRTFDDVLIKPRFSDISSRKEIDLTVEIAKTRMTLPVISANMSSVTGVDMAAAMIKAGGMGCLHRFWSIEHNHFAARDVHTRTGEAPWVSVGLGIEEWKRVTDVAAYIGATIVIDVAHGAQQRVADFFKRIREKYPEAGIVVGNFATQESIEDFIAAAGYVYSRDFAADGGAIKVGVGPGSACTTRIKTGIGVPQLEAILDCARAGVPLIADGGLRTPGDIAKAIAAGASAVMVGGMLAGTNETPGEVTTVGEEWKSGELGPYLVKAGKPFKKYYGSASKDAYQEQGKDSSYITAEGESFLVPCKGPVSEILKDVEGGLRSAFSYVGARTVKDFQKKADFISVSGNAVRENGAHGKTGG